MKSILFYRKAEMKVGGADNANLRHLDQGWRLDPRRLGEVIVEERRAGRSELRGAERGRGGVDAPRPLRASRRGSALARRN